jgi:hypothetical protein
MIAAAYAGAAELTMRQHRRADGSGRKRWRMKSWSRVIAPSQPIPHSARRTKPEALNHKDVEPPLTIKRLAFMFNATGVGPNHKVPNAPSALSRKMRLSRMLAFIDGSKTSTQL